MAEDGLKQRKYSSLVFPHLAVFFSYSFAEIIVLGEVSGYVCLAETLKIVQSLGQSVSTGDVYNLDRGMITVQTLHV